jgi:hypothetical protein
MISGYVIPNAPNPGHGGSASVRHIRRSDAAAQCGSLAVRLWFELHGRGQTQSGDCIQVYPRGRVRALLFVEESDAAQACWSSEAERHKHC